MTWQTETQHIAHNIRRRVLEHTINKQRRLFESSLFIGRDACRALHQSDESQPERCADDPAAVHGCAEQNKSTLHRRGIQRRAHA